MWDIYGETLEQGHCEVHPWVHCEYPCPVCINESDQKKKFEDQATAYCAEIDALYSAEIEKEFADSMNGAGI